MNIEIKTYQKNDLSAIVGLYNELAESIPFNWPVTEAEFRDEILGSGKLSNPDFPFNPVNMLVAWIDGSAVGFVHFAFVTNTAGEKSSGL